MRKKIIKVDSRYYILEITNYSFYTIYNANGIEIEKDNCNNYPEKFKKEIESAFIEFGYVNKDIEIIKKIPTTKHIFWDDACYFYIIKDLIEYNSLLFYPSGDQFYEPKLRYVGKLRKCDEELTIKRQERTKYIDEEISKLNEEKDQIEDEINNICDKY